MFKYLESIFKVFLILIVFSSVVKAQTPLYGIEEAPDSMMTILTKPFPPLGDGVQHYVTRGEFADALADYIMNIYNADGTLVSNRNVDLSTFDLDFIDNNGDKVTIDGSIMSVNNNGGANYEIQTTGTQAIIGTSTNHPLLFQTNLTERARIKETGEFNLTGVGNDETVDNILVWDASGDIHYRSADGLNSSSPFFYGSTTESVRFDVTSDGVSVTASIEQSGGGDIDFLFSDGLYTFDATPAATVTLTAGTDANPQINYVYVLQSDKTLYASTTGYPASEYAPIGTVLVQSASDAQTNGLYKVHAWTDHLSSTNGHLGHLNYWIRNQPASYVSGINWDLNDVPDDEIWMDVTSGTVLQLHPHTFPAFSDRLNFDYKVVNHPVSAYTNINEFSDILVDANNVSMSGNYYTIVVWGVISEDSEDCHLFVNLPTGSYGNEANALNDIDRYTVYDIPTEFLGTGFLIAEFLLKHSPAGGGAWTSVLETDLRGKTPSAVSGGGSGESTTFQDSDFEVFDNLDPTKIMKFEADQISTGTTRTYTAPNKDGTIALLDDVIFEDTGTEIKLKAAHSTDDFNVHDVLYVDESLTTVGINNTTPSAALEIGDGLTGQPAIKINTSLAGYDHMKYHAWGMESSGNAFTFIRPDTDNTGHLQFGFNGRDWEYSSVFVDKSHTLYVDNLPRIRANSIGVGINNTNPQQMLEVTGNALIKPTSTTGGNGAVGLGEYQTLTGFAPNIVFDDISSGIDSMYIVSNQEWMYVGRTDGLGGTQNDIAINGSGEFYMYNVPSTTSSNLLTLNSGRVEQRTIASIDVNDFANNIWQESGGVISPITSTADLNVNDVLFVDESTYNVGIGTVTPNARLDVAGITEIHVDGNYTSGGRMFKFYEPVANYPSIAARNGNDTGDAYFRLESYATIFNTAGIEGMRLDQNQNLGVGTAVPAARIHAHLGATSGGIEIETTGTGNYAGLMIDADRTWGLLSGGSTHPIIPSHLGIYDFTAAQYRMVIDDSGRVGLGTTSPSEELHLRGSGNTIAIAETTTTGSASGFKSSTNGQDYGWFAGGSTHSLIPNKFGIYDYDASTYRVVLDDDKLGIGITSPEERLVVSGGNIQLRGTTYTDFSDYWGASDNSAIFTPYGFLGSNGAFGVSLYSNGYRNVSSGFTYVGINGNTNTASGIDLYPTGDVHIRSGTATGTTLPTILFGRASGGQIGIGTTNPLYGRLEVKQESDAVDKGLSIMSSAGNTMRLWLSGSTSYIYSNGSGTSPLILNTPNSAGSGYIGIGTDSPQEKVDIRPIVYANNQDGGIQLAALTGEWSSGMFLRSDGGGVPRLGFDINSSEALVIRSGGHVGIGNVVPDERLEVTHTEPIIKISSEDNIGDAGGTEVIGGIEFEGNQNALYSPSGKILSRQSGNTWSAAFQYNAPSDLEFYVQDNTTTDYTNHLTQVPILTLHGIGQSAGIGTREPTEVLDVNGKIRMREGAADQFMIVGNSTGVMTWTNPSSVNLSSFNDDLGIANYWARSGTTTYLLNSGDNVGVGTTTPSDKLTIDGDFGFEGGSIRYLGSELNAGELWLLNGGGYASNSGSYVGLTGSYGIMVAPYIAFNTGKVVGSGFGSEAMRIISTGEVGIGTNSPESELHVQGVGGIYVKADATGENQAGFHFESGAANKYWLLYTDADNADARLYSSVLTSPAMTWKESGNVGVGENNPTQKLVIDGNIFTTDDGTANEIRTYYSDGSYASYNGWGFESDFSSVQVRPVDDRARPLYLGLNTREFNNIYQYFSGTAIWYYQEAAKMTLNSSGLGVGVTPVVPLQVLGEGRFQGTTNTTHFNYGGNQDAYIRSGQNGGFVAIQDGGRGDVNIQNGNLYADDSTDKIGIGITLPDTKLHVYDNVAAAHVLKVENANNASAAAHSVINIANGGSTGGDVRQQFTLTGETTYYMGADNSDNTFRIDKDSPTFGSPAFIIGTNEYVGIGALTYNPSKRLHVYESGASAQAMIQSTSTTHGAWWDFKNGLKTWRVGTNTTSEFIVQKLSDAGGAGFTAFSIDTTYYDTYFFSGIRLNASTATGTSNGTIRYTGSDFEGRKAGAWVSLTATSGGSADGNGIFDATNDGSLAPNNMDVGLTDVLEFGTNLLWMSESSSEIGINTGAPEAELDVNGVIRARGGTYVNVSDMPADVGMVIASGDYLYADVGSYTRRLIGINGTGDIDIGQTGTSIIDRITLKAGNGSGTDGGIIGFNYAGAERIRFAANEYVGIGDLTPDYLVDIERSSSSGSSGFFPELRVSNTNTTGYSFAAITAASENEGVTAKLLTSGDGAGNAIDGVGGGTGTATNHNFTVYSNNTYRMTVEADGDIEMDNGTFFLDESANKISVTGDLQIDHASAVTGYVWTATDAAGNGSWQSISGSGDGDGIYDGSGSLSGTTTVTMAANDLVFSTTTGDFEISSGDAGIVLNDIGLSSYDAFLEADGGSFKIHRYNADTDAIVETGFIVELDAPDQSFTIKADGKVGLGDDSPVEVLDVNGAINLGSTTNTNTGTIRWNGTNFQGYNGTSWIGLDVQGGTDGDGIYDGSGDLPSAITITGTTGETITYSGGVGTTVLNNGHYITMENNTAGAFLEIFSSSLESTDSGVVRVGDTDNLYLLAGGGTVQGIVIYGDGDTEPTITFNSELEIMTDFDATNEIVFKGQDEVEPFMLVDLDQGYGEVTFEEKVYMGNGATILTDVEIRNSSDVGKFFFDTVNTELGVGTVTPSATLDVNGDSKLGGTTNDVATINDVLKLTPRSGAPATAEKGMLYAHTDGSLYFYNGSSWDKLN